MQDPIIDDIRKIRKEIEEDFQNDPQKHLKHVQEAQKKHGEKLVSRKPRLIPKKVA